MKREIFQQNIEWNYKQVFNQFVQAQKVNGRAKSGFYKAAIIFSASVVEALAYKLLERNLEKEMPLEDWSCAESTLLPNTFIVNGSRLSICKRIQQRFQLKKHTDFKKVNEICKKLNIFSQSFYEKVEKIRELRNKVHIQGLDRTDRSYTKRELELISFVMDELWGKLHLNVQEVI